MKMSTHRRGSRIRGKNTRNFGLYCFLAVMTGCMWFPTAIAQGLPPMDTDQISTLLQVGISIEDIKSEVDKRGLAGKIGPEEAKKLVAGGADADLVIYLMNLSRDAEAKIIAENREIMLFPFRDKSGKWGFIDSKINVILQPHWDKVSSFREGLAPVKIDGKWGYIDIQGKIIINPQWDRVSPFYKGMAYMVEGGKYGFLNKQGKVVSQPQWDNPYWAGFYQFSEGLVCIVKDNKWGFIDQQGKIISQSHV